MSSPVFAAAAARRLLKRLARPAGSFDARRYFRGTIDLRFHNVGTAAMRKLARSIHAQHASGWTVNDAAAFADDLIVDRYLEVKGIGIELLARYRREFSPRLLPMWKRWLASGHAANWATTDAICGSLIGPLLVAHRHGGLQHAPVVASSQFVGASSVGGQPDSLAADGPCARPRV